LNKNLIQVGEKLYANFGFPNFPLSDVNFSCGGDELIVPIGGEIIKPPPLKKQ